MRTPRSLGQTDLRKGSGRARPRPVRLRPIGPFLDLTQRKSPRYCGQFGPTILVMSFCSSWAILGAEGRVEAQRAGPNPEKKWWAQRARARRVGGPKFRVFFLSRGKCRSFSLSRGIVSAVQGRGPPQLCVWASLVSFCVSLLPEILTTAVG